MKIAVQTTPFDLNAEVNALHREQLGVGAIATFIGTVRHEAGQVSELSLEHYPGMTEAALRDIVTRAQVRWPLLDATVIHRVGPLAPGEPIVLVAVASVHRGEAFAACEFIMDFLKTEAPFWKKETTPEGVHWVDARDSDDHAASRWLEEAPTQKP